MIRVHCKGDATDLVLVSLAIAGTPGEAARELFPVESAIGKRSAHSQERGSDGPEQKKQQEALEIVRVRQSTTVEEADIRIVSSPRAANTGHNQPLRVPRTKWLLRLTALNRIDNVPPISSDASVSQNTTIHATRPLVTTP